MCVVIFGALKSKFPGSGVSPSLARRALKARLQVRRVFTINADPSVALVAETVKLARLAVDKGRDDPQRFCGWLVHQFHETDLLRGDSI